MGDDGDTVSATIEGAVKEKTALLWLTDSKGKRWEFRSTSWRTSRSPVPT